MVATVLAYFVHKVCLQGATTGFLVSVSMGFSLSVRLWFSGKLAKPRQLHNTLWGMMCPAETPEGQVCFTPSPWNTGGGGSVLCGTLRVPLAHHRDGVREAHEQRTYDTCCEASRGFAETWQGEVLATALVCPPHELVPLGTPCSPSGVSCMVPDGAHQGPCKTRFTCLVPVVACGVPMVPCDVRAQP